MGVLEREQPPATLAAGLAARRTGLPVDSITGVSVLDPYFYGALTPPGCVRRHAAGGMPNSRRKARLNAASDS